MKAGELPGCSAETRKLSALWLIQRHFDQLSTLQALKPRGALKCGSVYCRALDRPVFKPRWALLCSLRGLFPALRRARSPSYMEIASVLFIYNFFLMRKLLSESLWHGSDPGSGHADPWLHLLHHLFEHTLHISRIHALFFFFFYPFLQTNSIKNKQLFMSLRIEPRAVHDTDQHNARATTENGGGKWRGDASLPPPSSWHVHPLSSSSGRDSVITA